MKQKLEEHPCYPCDHLVDETVYVPGETLHFLHCDTSITATTPQERCLDFQVDIP